MIVIERPERDAHATNRQLVGPEIYAHRQRSARANYAMRMSEKLAAVERVSRLVDVPIAGTLLGDGSRMAPGDKLRLATTGDLPEGLDAGTDYVVVTVDENRISFGVHK